MDVIIMDDPIKVLVVDDALFMRKAISEILQSDKSLSVIGTARDGLDGLEKIRQLQPDVVTMDIDMPRMDGLEAIRHIMIESPVPVVVLSSLFSDGAVTFEALRMGVLDFVPKPSGGISEDMDKSRRRIIDRVKIAGSVNFENIRRVRMQTGDLNENLSVKYGFHPLEYLITLGTTLSGPNTVIRLLSRLSPIVPAAMVVVQEIAPQILPSFVKKFDEHVPWSVTAAQDGQVLEQGVCYVCSNTQSVHVERNESGQPCIRISDAVDHPLNELFISAAELFRDKAIGVLLTGVGEDGADGFARIRENGGDTIAQDSDCCVYPNLTNNAIEKGTVNTIVDEIRLPGAIAAAMS
jgi:two-component system, chemotaxis family, protein-glutamate methylesterase/glutaminase